MDVAPLSRIAEACSHLAPGQEQLERLIEDILEVPRTDAERLRGLWMPLAALLAAHLDEKDRCLVPAIGRIAARDAHALVLEHRHLRARVAQLDMAFGVGTLAPLAVRSFAEEVMAHHRRERALLTQFAPVEAAAV